MEIIKSQLIFLKLLNGKTIRHFGFCLLGKKQENCSLNISTKNVGSTSTCIHGYISYAMIFCIYGKWKASTWKIRQKDSSSVLLNYQKCINEKSIRWKMQNTLLSKRTSALTGHNRLNFYDQKKFSAKFKWEWKSRSVENM